MLRSQQEPASLNPNRRMDAKLLLGADQRASQGNGPQSGQRMPIGKCQDTRTNPRVKPETMAQIAPKLRLSHFWII